MVKGPRAEPYRRRPSSASLDSVNARYLDVVTSNEMIDRVIAAFAASPDEGPPLPGIIIRIYATEISQRDGLAAKTHFRRVSIESRLHCLCGASYAGRGRSGEKMNDPETNHNQQKERKCHCGGYPDSHLTDNSNVNSKAQRCH
jgi:hypothetical protein